MKSRIYLTLLIVCWFCACSTIPQPSPQSLIELKSDLVGWLEKSNDPTLKAVIERTKSGEIIPVPRRGFAFIGPWSFDFKENTVTLSQRPGGMSIWSYRYYVKRSDHGWELVRQEEMEYLL
jgi:hypothetical protein